VPISGETLRENPWTRGIVSIDPIVIETINAIKLFNSLEALIGAHSRH
jgi:hypothetical protein